VLFILFKLNYLLYEINFLNLLVTSLLSVIMLFIGLVDFTTDDANPSVKELLARPI